jgi:hypothetical protein
VLQYNHLYLQAEWSQPSRWSSSGRCSFFIDCIAKAWSQVLQILDVERIYWAMVFGFWQFFLSHSSYCLDLLHISWASVSIAPPLLPFCPIQLHFFLPPSPPLQLPVVLLFFFYAPWTSIRHIDVAWEGGGVEEKRNPWTLQHVCSHHLFILQVQVLTNSHVCSNTKLGQEGVEALAAGLRHLTVDRLEKLSVKIM